MGGVVGEHLDGLVRQEPYADVGEVEMVFLQSVERVDRWLLQHTLERRGVFAGAHKHAMILGNLRSKPQAIAHHVGLGDGLQGLGGANIHVTAHNHRAKALGRTVHDALVERQLQLQEVL